LRGRSDDGSKRQLRQHSDPSPQQHSYESGWESGWHGLWWTRRVRVLTRSIGTSKSRTRDLCNLASPAERAR
jgi:hypothetical protein